VQSLPIFFNVHDRTIRTYLGARWFTLAEIASDDGAVHWIHTRTSERTSKHTHAAADTDFPVCLHGASGLIAMHGA
jgi:hypothetical protein